MGSERRKPGDSSSIPTLKPWRHFALRVEHQWTGVNELIDRIERMASLYLHERKFDAIPIP
jgi:hypothetical protein